MAQLFGRTKPNRADETIQRTKEKITDVTKNSIDRQRHLKQLIGKEKNYLQTFSYQYLFEFRSIIY